MKQIKAEHVCIIAFHIGHSTISEDIKAKDFIEQYKDGCCGGVWILNYCPECGMEVDKKWKQMVKK